MKVLPGASSPHFKTSPTLKLTHMDSTHTTYWSYAIASWFDEGRENPDTDAMKAYIAAALPQIASCWEPRGDGPTTRPSGGLSCARQLWLTDLGYQKRQPGEATKITWAMGHLLHAWVYGCLTAGAPDGVVLEVEHTRELPAWWPKERAGFAQDGHTDIVIQRQSDTAGGLPAECGRRVLADVKSTNKRGWSDYSKKDWATSPDAFGYVSQMATYSDGGALYDACFILAVNRDTPASSKLVVRNMGNDVLEAEKARLIQTFAQAEDPGYDFMERNGKGGAFYCENYCDLRDACKELVV